jgi:hypothetical protein
LSDNAVFAALRAILGTHAATAAVTTNAPDHYALGRPDAAGKVQFLAAVQTKKSYVAYHLFPIYTDPALLDGVSPELKARMQGKSCFNFKVVDNTLFAELQELTARALLVPS